MSYQLVPKSVTLNDLERRSGCYFRYFSEIVSIRGVLCKVNIPKLSATGI